MRLFFFSFRLKVLRRKFTLLIFHAFFAYNIYASFIIFSRFSVSRFFFTYLFTKKLFKSAHKAFILLA